MRALIIARRELYAYLRSPLGSAIIAAALLVDGILFYFASVDTKRLSAQLLSQFFYDSSAATMMPPTPCILSTITAAISLPC